MTGDVISFPIAGKGSSRRVAEGSADQPGAPRIDATSPPSMRRSVPVMNEAASDTRNATAAATSVQKRCGRGRISRCR
jgi:hypothetical protein